MQVAEPSQNQLDRILRGATRLRVLNGRAEAGAAGVLYETGRAEELAELRECLRIHDGGVGHCMCNGTVRFELTASESPGEVTLHHGVTVRWEPTSTTRPW